MKVKFSFISEIRKRVALLIVLTMIISIMPQQIMIVHAQEVTDYSWSYDEGSQTLTFSVADGDSDNQMTITEKWSEAEYKDEIVKAKKIVFNGDVKINGYYYEGYFGEIKDSDGNQNLTSVEFKGKANVGAYAFKDNRSLKEIKFEGDANFPTHPSEDAQQFACCSNLELVTFNGTLEVEDKKDYFECVGYPSTEIYAGEVILPYLNEVEWDLTKLTKQIVEEELEAFL